MGSGARTRHPAGRGRGQKRGATADTCASQQERVKRQRQEIWGAKVHAVLCAVRAQEQRSRERKREREQRQPNGPVRTESMRTISGRTAGVGMRACGGEEENQRKPKTPRIQSTYYRAYPDTPVPAVDDSLWDGRPKRSRMREGALDQVQRRGPRQEGRKKKKRRQRVSIVPATTTGGKRRRAFFRKKRAVAT